MEGPLAALEMLFEPISLMLLCGGTAFGIILGALPGLSATMGLALAMPFTYYLPVEKAMPLLLGVYLGAVIGASIPAILIGIPGILTLSPPSTTALRWPKRALLERPWEGPRWLRS